MFQTLVILLSSLMEDTQILHQKVSTKNISNNYKTKLKKAASKKILNVSMI